MLLRINIGSKRVISMGEMFDLYDDPWFDEETEYDEDGVPYVTADDGENDDESEYDNPDLLLL